MGRHLDRILVNDHIRLRVTLLDADFNLVGQRMRLTQWQVAVNIKVQLDKLGVTRLPGAQVMKTQHLLLLSHYGSNIGTHLIRHFPVQQ